MAINFGDEHLKLIRWMRGVYKVVLNDKWFYIGSSIDLKRRLSGWKHILKHGNFISKNGNLKFIHSEITDVRFEILEYVSANTNPKSAENVYIKQHFDNELCLNISNNSFFNTKNKKPYGYVPKPVRVKKPPTPAKPLGYFDKDGNLVTVFKSVAEASRKTGCNDSSISAITRGKHGFYKGHSFKYQLPDGLFVEPPKFISVSEKPIKQFDINGNFIREYKSIVEATEILKCQRGNLMKVLRGHYGYKTCKGFIFRYSDENHVTIPRDKYGNPI